ncbi:MAG: 3-phosphoshikimate 1-carboxyvinyltransferase [Oceanipulchritudo sp.]
MLPDPYPVRPWEAPCRGEVVVPGSKSLTNRALLLAALAAGETRLSGALFSRDTRLLIEALAALGFDLEADPEGASIRIVGRGGSIPGAHGRFHVGNAGTVARFLTAFVCLRPGGRFGFDSDEEMYRRPMGGLIEALQSLGARFHFKGRPGCFPFEIETAGLPGGDWHVDARASSQMLSALLLVAPKAGGEVRLQAPAVRPAFVEMTAGLLRQSGVTIEGSAGEGFRIPGNQQWNAPPEGEFAIEPDVTAASYFLTLPAVTGGSLLLRGLHDRMLQGDRAYAGILKRLGLSVRQETQGWRVEAGTFPAVPGGSFDFEEFSDTFLTFAALAPLLPFPVRVTGIGHTRHQETDRVRAMATELRRVGSPVNEGPDFLQIGPFPPDLTADRFPVDIETYRDHRIAMSFAVLGSSPRFGAGSPWLRIRDPECCRKTFPGFFAQLQDLYLKCHDM